MNGYDKGYEAGRKLQREKDAVIAWSEGIKQWKRNQHDAREIGSYCASAIREQEIE